MSFRCRTSVDFLKADGPDKSFRKTGQVSLGLGQCWDRARRSLGAFRTRARRFISGPDFIKPVICAGDPSFGRVGRTSHNNFGS